MTTGWQTSSKNRKGGSLLHPCCPSSQRTDTRAHTHTHSPRIELVWWDLLAQVPLDQQQRLARQLWISTICFWLAKWLVGLWNVTVTWSWANHVDDDDANVNSMALYGTDFHCLWFRFSLLPKRIELPCGQIKSKPTTRPKPKPTPGQFSPRTLLVNASPLQVLWGNLSEHQ